MIQTIKIVAASHEKLIAFNDNILIRSMKNNVGTGSLLIGCLSEKFFIIIQEQLGPPACINHRKQVNIHYNDAIMTMIASQITSLAVVYSTVYSDAEQRKHQRSASLAFVLGSHRDRWIPRRKGQLRGKRFHLMTSSCQRPVSVASLVKWTYDSLSTSKYQFIRVVIYINDNRIQKIVGLFICFKKTSCLMLLYFVISMICIRFPYYWTCTGKPPPTVFLFPTMRLLHEYLRFSLLVAWTIRWTIGRHTGGLDNVALISRHEILYLYIYCLCAHLL